MNPILIIVALAFLVTTIGQAEEKKMPLIVDTPPQWRVEFKGEKGIQFYAVKRNQAEPALLMFSRWPAPGNTDQIPKIIESMAKGFLDQARKNSEIKLESEEYKIEKIQGVEFSGEYAAFTISNGLVQTLFMMSDGDGIWNGQFTGSKERWVEALDILKKLKKS